MYYLSNEKKTLRRAAGCTPRPIRTMPDWLSAARPIRTKSDRFGVRNGSTRWRCPERPERGGPGWTCPLDTVEAALATLRSISWTAEVLNWGQCRLIRVLARPPWSGMGARGRGGGGERWGGFSRVNYFSSRVFYKQIRNLPGMFGDQIRRSSSGFLEHLLHKKDDVSVLFRASPLTRPMRPPAGVFFIRTA
jgi:hypothetical protein